MGKFARFAKFAALVGIVILSAVVLSAPVHAQGPLPTPTPYPAIAATRTASQARLDAANAQKAEADRLNERAAEIRRNGDAQAQQAQTEINQAREAAATQNGVAIGEAIGRVESTVNQLRDTVAGQAAIIATANATMIEQAQTIISQSLELQALRVDKQTLQANYAATVSRAEEAQRAGGAAPVVALVIFVAIVGIVAVLLVVVLQRRGQTTIYPAGAGDVVDNDDGVGE